MRKLAVTVLALAFAPGVVPSKADVPKLDGRWKLTVLAYGDDDYLIFDVKTVKGRPTSMVASAQPLLGPLETAEIVARGDDLTITFPAAVEVVFRGTLEGDKAPGTLTFKGMPFPARIEKTAAARVSPLRAAPVREKVLQAGDEEDPKRRVAKLKAVIAENRGRPTNGMAYPILLASADAAGLPAAEVRGHVDAWLAEARPYGPGWVGEVRRRALKVLEGKKAFAAIATDLAGAAEKALPDDAPLEARGELAASLARSARLGGMDAVAAEAESRLKAIDAKLDAEYLENVPPFKPAPFAGRKGGKTGRTVVMEVFSGAECPPCVAVDVGFDALLSTYKPTEFIGLGYHLHSPGPDPLTNPDSLAREAYYGDDVMGTPSTFIDGKVTGREGGGGGPLERAEVKYNEFRGLIEPALEAGSPVDIRLTADRAGDEVKIAAAADVTAKGGASRNARPRLRVVLVEKTVRYQGGNGIRLHHNIVRAFPGGVEGRALDGGKGEVTATVKLSDLRKRLASYVEAFPDDSGRSFPQPPPPIELDALAVVAFVQDDADHAIWHGIQVPVKGANP